MKKFNIAGSCIPEKHYAVDITPKIQQIFTLVEEGEYFTINRPRQYGKTTTLFFLNRFLKEQEDYYPILISFEGIGTESQEREAPFVEAFFLLLKKIFLLQKDQNLLQFAKDSLELTNFPQLNYRLTELLSMIGKKVVLLIDEVDRSSNNQLFLEFLGLLRTRYLAQQEGRDLAFHSVILAGVHDIKNLKQKIRIEQDSQESSAPYNSPWNIAVDFKVKGQPIRLSFSPEEIETMLADYCQEKGISMEISIIAKQLYHYTSGYPFLVSKLCKIVDEELLEDSCWSLALLEQAVQMALKETNTNFESLIKNLKNDPELYVLVEKMILDGFELSFNQDHSLIQHGIAYGIFRNENGIVKIHNRIYEQRIYNFMVLNLQLQEVFQDQAFDFPFRDQVLRENNELDLTLVLSKFQSFMQAEYSKRDQSFLERNGRLIFLAFLKPILNGRGFTFNEVQISEEKRLDVVLTYREQRFVVELKLWKGKKQHEKGLQQLHDYLERLNLDQGYLVIFDLTKGRKHAWKQDQRNIQGKEILMIWV